MTDQSTNQFAALSDAIADCVEAAGKVTLGVSARRRGPASGLGWRPGLVVTADHVVEREESITVFAPDGAKMQASLSGRDPSTDLAILSVPEWTAEAAWRIEENPRAGQLVVAVGRHGEAGVGASFGALSSVGGEFRTHGGGRIDRFLRPDLTFYPGFSGGPLLTAEGALIGMNTSGLAHGLPLTVPGSTVNRVVDQLMTTGRIKRGYLGLRLQAVDLGEAVAGRHGLSQNDGLLVVGVEPDGPGAEAGLLVGDVLVTIGGRHAGQSENAQVQLDAESIGKELPLSIIRGGEQRTVSLVVGERPARRHRHG